MKNKKRIASLLATALLAGCLLSACEEKPAAAQEPAQVAPSITISDAERLAKNSEALKNAAIGDYVFWGAYEQDNNLENGKEEIEWLVLDIKDGKAFLISKKGLDQVEYFPVYNNATWETSTLRAWLNSDFLNAAFTAEEQALIPTVTVEPGTNPRYRRTTDAGPATQDQVYVLSIMEAYQYFETDEARKCEPTDYAVANGVIKNSVDGNCWWWLRSPGYYQYTAAGVFGYIQIDGYDVNGTTDAARPVIWVDLNKL